MRILMTGASRSLGYYVYNQLTNLGHDVFGLGLGGPNLALDLREVTSPSRALELVRECQGNGPPFDFFLSNAGMTVVEKLGDTTQEDWDDVLQVNLTAPFWLTQAWMAQAKAGRHEELDQDVEEQVRYRAVYVLSMAHKQALRHCHAYNASKAGLANLIRGLAKSNTPGEGDPRFSFLGFAPIGIQGTAMIEQSIKEIVRTRGWPEQKARKYVEQGHPMGRLVTFEECWAYIRFCLFEAPESATGTIFNMEGGSGA